MTAKRRPAPRAARPAAKKKTAKTAKLPRPAKAPRPVGRRNGGVGDPRPAPAVPIVAKRSTAAAVSTAARPPLSVAPGTSQGKYVYCIIRANDALRFGPVGISAQSLDVYTINYRDVAAVVSDVPIGLIDSTRDNVLAHERVNEIVMRDHTVIPMSFGTIFKTREDTIELLRSAYEAFSDVLSKMQDKVEFGLKVLWDRDLVIRQIEQDDEDIHRLKTEISLQRGSTYFARMQYGRAIDNALQIRSERYVAEILGRLRSVAVASRINKPIGDRMIMNAAFLVSRDQESAFDAQVKAVATALDQMTFKYTGPWPPYNFVNIRLKLERV